MNTSRSVLLLVVAAGSLFAACGGGDDDDETVATTTTAGTLTPIDVASVPELADGVVSFGLNFKFPPMAYSDDAGQPAGFEVDLATALAAELGATAEFHQVANVEAIVGDAKAGTYEAVMASIRITTEREAEVDFVRYLGPVGMGILVLSGNSAGIRLLEDMCGRSIATTEGILDHEFYITETTGDFCSANPIDVHQYPDFAAGAEAVRTGEVEGQFAEDPAIAYAAAHSNGEMQQALVGFDSTHYGIGVSKESPQLTAAIQHAFENIRDSGEYADIIAAWALDDFVYTR